MKFALLKERKSIHEGRVLFSPQQLREIANRYSQHQFIVESSATRCFPDSAYSNLGFTVTTNINSADVFFGIKEVPLQNLIPYKTYFFFSHTTKMQPHNKTYLQGLIEKEITFYDYENFTNDFQKRLIAFGKSAGNIGAYHAIRTYGLKNGLFNLKKPSAYSNIQDLLSAIHTSSIPNIKIVLTGTGNVGNGAASFLNNLRIQQLSPIDFLSTTTYTKPVFTQLKKADYLSHSLSNEFNENDFKRHPYNYKSDFLKYTKQADILITGHYYHKDMPMLFTTEEVNHADFNINTIADISCDLLKPIPTCLRASTTENPIYGYQKNNGLESNYTHKNSVAVMAVDNLPCELPEYSSTEFGNQFIEEVLPHLMINFNHPIIEKACVLKNGKISDSYQYLEDFISLNPNLIPV